MWDEMTDEGCSRTVFLLIFFNISCSLSVFWLMPLSRLASLASRLLVRTHSGHVCGHRGRWKADVAVFGQRLNWMQSKLG